MNVRTISITSILLATSLLSPAHAATHYTIQDLGVLVLNTSQYDQQNLKIRLNNNNVVVGWERTNTASNADFKGFIWNSVGGKDSPLNLSSYKFTDVNDGSEIVGHVYDDNGVPQSNTWNSDFSISTPISGTSSQSYGINATGQIAGSRLDMGDVPQAFTSNNAISTLITDTTSTLKAANEATAISDSGFATGRVFVNGVSQAFIWDSGTLTTLSDINSAITFGWGSDINNSNQVVGGYSTGAAINNVQGFYTNSAYVWDLTNGFSPLIISNDVVAWGTAINDDASIVGGAILNNKPGEGLVRSAVLWENGTAYELSTLVTDIGNWQLRDATDINIDGYIVGIGQINNAYHAFMLTPQPDYVLSADLAISAVVINPVIKKLKSNTIVIGDNQSLGFQVTNLGPDSATNIKIEFNSTLVEKVLNLTGDKGECSIDAANEVIDCDIDRLIKDESAVFSFQLAEDTELEYDIAGNVKADQVDPITENKNSFNEKVTITASEIIITTPPVQQNPDTSNPPVETAQTDNPTTNDTTKTSASSSSKSSSSGWGCTIGKSTVFDPMFFMLLIVAIFGVVRHKKVT